MSWLIEAYLGEEEPLQEGELIDSVKCQKAYKDEDYPKALYLTYKAKYDYRSTPQYKKAKQKISALPKCSESQAKKDIVKVAKKLGYAAVEIVGVRKFLPNQFSSKFEIEIRGIPESAINPIIKELNSNMTSASWYNNGGSTSKTSVAIDVDDLNEFISKIEEKWSK